MPSTTAAPAYWLVKSEPFKYSFAQLQKDKRTVWDGVRNYEARNNLRAMRRGDLLLFYHSNEDKAVVGIARVAKQAYADPTDDTGTWSVVDVAPVKALRKAVTLDTIRETAGLAEITMLKRNRLSVTPVRPEEFAEILSLGKTKAPPGRTA
jgi:predicted RNA-binding protein with PUA-like domain